MHFNDTENQIPLQLVLGKRGPCSVFVGIGGRVGGVSSIADYTAVYEETD